MLLILYFFYSTIYLTASYFDFTHKTYDQPINYDVLMQIKGPAHSHGCFQLLCLLIPAQVGVVQSYGGSPKSTYLLRMIKKLNRAVREMSIKPSLCEAIQKKGKNACWDGTCLHFNASIIIIL